MSRLRKADELLVQGRLTDASPLYEASTRDFHAVLASLNKHIETLLTDGKANLQAGLVRRRRPAIPGRAQNPPQR